MQDKIGRMSIIRLQHIGMAVADYERARRQFEHVGLPMRDFRNDQGKGLQHDGRILLGNECWLHVVHNWNPESRVNQFLARHGQKLEHLALETDDIEADVSRLRDLGVPIFEDKIFDANDGYEAFVYPSHAIGFTVELIQPHEYSWGYPEDAADVPVERLDWIAATVDDVGTASRRFEKLFGTGAREARIRFGNRCSLHLKRDPAGDTGLDAMCLSMRENGERLSTVTDLGFRLVAGSR